MYGFTIIFNQSIFLCGNVMLNMSTISCFQNMNEPLKQAQGHGDDVIQGRGRSGNSSPGVTGISYLSKWLTFIVSFTVTLS